MMTAIDLSRLPAPNVIEELEYEAILQAMVDDLRTREPSFDAIVESDPAYKVLEVAAYRELLMRQRINDAARAVMLAYADGSDLDQIGALFGVARLDGETDARMRDRSQQGFWATAAAGPGGAYRSHAMAVDVSIIDVSAASFAPGEVTVTVLAPETDSGIIQDASEDERTHGAAAFPGLPVGSAVIAGNASTILDQVRAALSAEDVRPLTDHVIVRRPDVKPFTIEAELVLYPGPEEAEALILADASKRLEDYLARIHRMDYDATRARIIGALSVPEVQNVVLTSPASDIVTTPVDLALCLSVSLTVGGRDV